MKSSFSSDAPTYVHRFGMPARWRLGGGATSALSLLGAVAPAHQNLAQTWRNDRVSRRKSEVERCRWANHSADKLFS